MNLFDLKVSLYKGVKDNVGQIVKLEDIGIAGNPQREKQITAIRNAQEQAKKDELKKALPAVTWSGTFKKRNARLCIDYTGLICLDIDKLDANELKLVKKRLKADPYTSILFTSPSGNGLKVIFFHAHGVEKHLEVFLQMAEHIESMYGVKVDPSGKDVSRLCFLSFDDETYINEKAKPFDYDENYKPALQPANGKKGVPVPPATKAKGKGSNNKKTDSHFSGNLKPALEWVEECTNKQITYTEGNRNNYVYQFACIANREGISEADTLNYLLGIATDLKQDELVASIKSAYNHNATEHGTEAQKKAEKYNTSRKTATTKCGKEISLIEYGNNGTTRNLQNTNSSIQPSNANSNGNRGNQDGKKGQNIEAPQFWVWETDEKGRDKLKLLYNELVDFLAFHGFYRMPLKDGFYQFIQYKDNVVAPVTTLDMKDYVFDYLQANGERAVLEMCRRGSKNYFTAAILEGLPKKEVVFKKDTEHEQFFYFKNGIVRITKEGSELLSYSSLDGAIWKSKMIDHEINLLKPDQFLTINDGQKSFNSPCHYANYLWHCSHNDVDSSQAVEWETRLQKFMAFITSTGYLLHEYKNPTITKAIVAIDHKLGEKHEQNGGSGKSLHGKAIGKMKKLATIPGKEFKEDYPFKFEMVTIDSKILFFNDVKRNFSFESIFEILTDDFTFNRRNIGFLNIPFEDSPKVYITSNHTLYGEGSSFSRRQHIIEFSDFFSDNNSPHDHFGHTFFLHWDKEQYNYFYNLFIWSVQCYLADGLIDYPGANYQEKKLINESTTEFIDFVDGIAKNWRHDKAELFKSYCEIHKASYNNVPTTISFYKWIKRYCESRGYILNGFAKYDKSNGKEYYTIWEANFYEAYKEKIAEMKARGISWTRERIERYAKGENLNPTI